MKHFSIILFLLSVCFSNGIAQEKTYTLEKKKDMILTGIGLSMNIIGYSLNTEGATIEGINNLDENNLLSIDRAAIYNNSENAQTISDLLLYSSLSIPFIIYSDKKCRSEGWSIGLMGLETFLITNGITTITKATVERYRPFMYNPDISLEKKLAPRTTFSFFSGHTSATTGLSFFAAKVLTDLQPDNKYNWLIWTVGVSAPAAMGYLRYEAGKHFLTDVIAGYAVGAIVGYLVPAAHLNKNINVGLGLAGTLDFRLTF